MVYSKILKVESLLANFPKNEGYLIAYSGGADSTALLHLMANVANVRAIHINHGLQTQANDWQNHCQKTCDQLKIPLIIEQADLSNDSESACREARYGFFSKHLKCNEILMTAHHAEDQAETVLLKLMRGTGINGLSGIETLKKFSQGFIGRPLLAINPHDLKAYLVNHDMKWIEDPSNASNQYRRNFLRNDIIPNLQLKFPNVISSINRSAENCRESLDLLNELCDFQGSSLPLKRLQETPESLQAAFFYQWLSQKNLPIPDRVTLNQLCQDFITAGSDKNPGYKNSYYQLLRWKQAIYCLKNYHSIDPNLTFKWQTSEDFEIPNGTGNLRYKGEKNQNFTVEFNKKGQRLKTHKHQFSKTVKQLFQENKIPLWERDNTPFIYHKDELVSLGYDWSHQDEFKDKIEYTFQEWFY
jgi:tRNA(Ile)-lysidine synthase